MTIMLLFLVIISNLLAQNKTAEDFGFRHIKISFNGDSVDVLIKSKEGEEAKPKPLLLFCQGSLPIPLIVYDEKGTYGVFPFNPENLSSDYHIIIVSKPYIPIISEAKNLRDNLTYSDINGNFPEKYSERNLLDYYVERNIEIIKYFQKQEWILDNKLVIAGHSEGSSVAAKLALIYPKVTHLIFSGGNPMGRIMTSIAQSRAKETNTDSTKYGNEKIEYWKSIVGDKDNMTSINGDTYKATYQFSIPPIQYLEKLEIPILVTYGTKDVSAPFNDYLQVEMINKNKTNFSFIPYVGTEHNFFPLMESGKTDYSKNNWNNVVIDWQKWLNNK